MATKHLFVYRGGGRESIPWNATHVSVDSSVTVIPARLFSEHQHIVELICHAGVIIIEEEAFECCRCLKRVVIPGVMIIMNCAFCDCTALEYVECDGKLEIIKECAFDCCRSLRSASIYHLSKSSNIAMHLLIAKLWFMQNLINIWNRSETKHFVSVTLSNE